MFPVTYNDSAVRSEPWIKEFLPGGSQWEEPTIKRNRERLNWWLDSIGIHQERFAYAEHGGFFHIWVYPTFQPHLAQPRHTPKSGKNDTRMELTDQVIERYILPDGPWANLSLEERRRKQQEWNSAYEKKHEAKETEEREGVMERMGQEITAHPDSPIRREQRQEMGESVAVTVPVAFTPELPPAQSVALSPSEMPFDEHEFVEKDVAAVPQNLLKAAVPAGEAGARKKR